MVQNSSVYHQPNLFGNDLLNQLDAGDPLIVLAQHIPWEVLEEKLSVFYHQGHGRPGKPIRLMAGLLMLKQLKNLSDEEVVLHWKQNPYFQYFCGCTEFQTKEPCHATELVKFRQRIGKTGVGAIFSMSVGLHGKKAEEKQVILDTTVQEKAITYPTDGKLAIRIIHHLYRIAKHEGIPLRRTYVKEIKEHRIALRFFRHPKKRQKAKASMKRLRTIAGVLMRDISRKLSDEQLLNYQERFSLYEKVIKQQKYDKDKVYALHEPHIYCIAKGKDQKQYEYGTKASVVTTKKSNIIVGVCAHDINEHDSKTAKAAIQTASANRQTPIKEAIADRGYRGIKQIGETRISLPGNPLKRDSRYQKEQKRKKFRRRAAIEPIIGHLKHDYRLSRNYLKGFMGDEINLLLAATAWNMAKWMAAYVTVLYLLKWMLHHAKKENDIRTFTQRYGDLLVVLFLLLAVRRG